MNRRQTIAVVIHHSASSMDTTYDQIESWHRNNWGILPGSNRATGYHFVIRKDGYRNTQPIELVGAHCNSGSYNNTNSIGVCVCGNFENDTPTAEHFRYLNEIYSLITAKYGKLKIVGHRDSGSTACPGRNLYNQLNRIGESMDTDKLSRIYRRAWIIMKGTGEEPHMPSIVKDAQQSIANHSDWTEDLFTNWAKAGIDKILKEKNKKISDLTKEIEKKDIAYSQLKKTSENANEAHAELIQKQIEDIKLLKGNIITLEEAAARMIVKTEKDTKTMTGWQLIIMGIKKWLKLNVKNVKE